MSAAWVRSSTSVPDPQSGNYCGVTVGAEPDFLRWAEHGDLVAEGPDEGVTPDETDELLTFARRVRIACFGRRNCNVNLDDLDWNRPDLGCEPPQARRIRRNLQLDETPVIGGIPASRAVANCSGTAIASNVSAATKSRIIHDDR